MIKPYIPEIANWCNVDWCPSIKHLKWYVMKYVTLLTQNCFPKLSLNTWSIFRWQQVILIPNAPRRVLSFRRTHVVPRYKFYNFGVTCWYQRTSIFGNSGVCKASWLIGAEWHIYASVYYAIIDSDKGLLQVRRQTISWRNARILLIHPS